MFKEEMTSTERVRATILGQPADRQPIYGWVYGNLTTEIDDMFGSLDGLERKYEYDMAHLFTGPWPFYEDKIEDMRRTGEPITPQMLLQAGIFQSPEKMEEYQPIVEDLKRYKAQHERFCYIQTPGLLEPFNGLMGIENHLLNMALYPDEMEELYSKLTQWRNDFARHCIELGVDMVHISDDWGAQTDMLISPNMWWNMIQPGLKETVDIVHENGSFASLHSDGCIKRVLDGVVDIGFDLIHPYQENANMPYDIYLNNYADKFAIMGGINVQNALGIMERDDLEKDIRRIFGLLRGKRWVVCTSHFVQKHCKVEDLKFAYDLIYQLARE